MSLFRGLRRIASTEPEKRQMSYQDIWGADLQFGGSTYAGNTVTQEGSLRMVAVWACVSLIADAISSLPLELYSEWGGVKRELAVPPWIYSPNTEMTFADCWHRVMVSLLLDGNAYIYVGRNSGAAISTLTPIHPQQVSVWRDPSTQKLIYNVGSERLTADDVLHIPAFTVPGSLTGYSAIEMARQAVGLGLVSEEYGARFFGQGATMSGVIEVPGDLTQDQATIMAKSFSDAHSGTRKAHLPGVLSGGGKWQPITVTNDQAQFLETRRFQKQEIANLFRVPPYMLDPTVSSTWGTGISEQNRAFVTHTLMPWLIRVEQAVSRLFPRGQYVKFNLDSLLRGQITERYQAYAVGLASGFLTVAEVREMEDLTELDFPEPDDQNIPAEGPPSAPLITNQPTGS